MSVLDIKGISYRFNDTFYVDIKPNANMKRALDDVIKTQNISLDDDNYVCGLGFLNVAYNIEDGSYNLSTWMSDWIDIPYEYTEAEKKEIAKFVNKWKDDVPSNVEGREYADDTEYVYSLSNNIPWKYKVLR